MNNIQGIPLNKLLLDKKNPRIHQDIPEEISQITLAKFIYDEFGISDLKDSILKNGYFSVEPLVVIPNINGADDEFIVVEGNRRLTTLKILCNIEYRKNCISEVLRSDFTATETLLEQSKELPVVIAKDRDTVKAYLGVRHLGGVKKWEPLAQSKYVYNQIIIQQDITDTKPIQSSIDRFVRDTNNKKNDVLNFFYKFCIYKSMLHLIENDKDLTKAKMVLDNKFSLLEVALGKTGTTSIAKYIGIDSYKTLNTESYEDVILEDNNDKVKNLVKWVFMPDSPIKESREINSHLKKILKEETSTKAFERGEDKDTALLLSSSSDDIVRVSCSKILTSLNNIQDNWGGTKPVNREDLKELYDYNVKQKVVQTNRHLDI